MIFLLIWLLSHPGVEVNLTSPQKRAFKITFYCSCWRCCGRHSPQKGGHGDTTLGNTPLPWRTAASGDPALAGRWVLLPDLGGEVYVSDTGVRCARTGVKVGTSRGRRENSQRGCVAPNQLDIFVGGPEHHVDALRLGVQWWEGEVRP